LVLKNIVTLGGYRYLRTPAFQLFQWQSAFQVAI
jgi:hypothetical protein